LGIYGFYEHTHELVLLHRMPGVALEEILANSGFEINLSEKVTEVPPPTPEELEIVRELDPCRLVLG